jgi:hypothetical protein
MKKIIITAIILLFASTAFCNVPSEKQMALINWMVFYYQKPDPDEFPRKILAFSEAGLLDQEKRQFPFLGFASTVFRENPSKIKAWVTALDRLPENHKRVVWLALWLSNTKESNALFKEQVHQKVISGRNYYNFETNESPPDLAKIDMLYGGFLDIQWGRFLATGDKEPISLIINTLEFGDFWGAQERYPNPTSQGEREAIIKEAIFKAAIWSLQSNCKTHGLVKSLCVQLYESGQLTEKESKYLRLVLSQVDPETYSK